MKKGILTISNPTANVSFTVNAEPSMPQLETPTGVEASGTTVSFNPVENAMSYEFIADITGEALVLGEYEVPSGYAVSVRSITGDGTTTFYVSFDNGSTWETVSASSVWSDKTTIKLKAEGYQKMGDPDRAFYYMNSGASESELASGFNGFPETENFMISSLTTANNELILGFHKGIDD